jgi:hypothetical protein
MFYKLNHYSLTLLASFFILKTVYVFYGIDKVMWALGVVLMCVNMLALLKYATVFRANAIPIIVFFLSGILAYLVSTLNGMLLMGSIGILGTYLYLILWSSFFALLRPDQLEKIFESYILVLLVLGLITALSCIYQYFIDYSLFGYNILHRVYSNVDNIAAGVTKRATSFMGGPQNLGLYMGVMFALVRLYTNNMFLKQAMYALFFIGGILSGSAAFIAFLLGYISWSLVGSNKHRVAKIHLFMLLSIFMAYFMYLQFIGVLMFKDSMFEALYIVDILTGRIEFYDLDIFLVHGSLITTLFGDGIGITDRLVEKFTNDNPPSGFVPGNESYILKLYFEQGLFGLLSFLSLYMSSVLSARKIKSQHGIVLITIYVGLASNLIFTTSFAGFTMSFILWPLLLYPIFRHKIQASAYLYHDNILDSGSVANEYRLQGFKLKESNKVILQTG